jgi:hypothetical protein
LSSRPERSGVERSAVSLFSSHTKPKPAEKKLIFVPAFA